METLDLDWNAHVPKVLSEMFGSELLIPRRMKRIIIDYDGIGCQYEMGACRANACQNGAACVDVGNGYHCACRPGFTGANCEVNIDDCQSSPCPQTATCIDQINGHFCKCPFNTTGVNCDKRKCNSSVSS